MAFEKKWAELSARSLIADGTVDGQLQIDDAFILRVKQFIYLQSNSEPPLLLQVKRVVSPTLFYVGSPEKDINHRIDVSAFLTADSAFIFNVDPNQVRPKISMEDFARAVYEEEPVVAIRSFLVDRGGRPIGSDPNSPFYVQLSDGSVNIGTVNAELEVQLSHQDDVPNAGDVHDSVRIGDGEDQLEINPDGSINANFASGQTPTIQNIEVTDADTEYEVVIPISTKKFKAKLRSNTSTPPGKLQVAYTSGETDTNYVSVSPGSWYIPSADLNLNSSLTLYFQSSKGDQTLEFESWA